MNLSNSAEHLAIAAGNKTTIVGGVTAVASGVAEKTGITAFLGEHGTEIAAAGVIAGFVFGLIGLVVQFIFNLRRDKREAEERREKREATQKREQREAEEHLRRMSQ